MPVRASVSGRFGVERGRQGKKLLREGLLCLRLKKAVAAGGYHDRIKHHVHGPVFPEFFRDHADHGGVSRHADLHRVGADVL